MASENFNNNPNKNMFLNSDLIPNDPNHQGEIPNHCNNANMFYNNFNGFVNNNENINNFNTSNNLLNKFENCEYENSSEYNFKNPNETNNHQTLNQNNNFKYKGNPHSSNYHSFENNQNKHFLTENFNCNRKINLSDHERNFNNNSINFNSSTYNNTLINKSTNNNSRLSIDNQENSKHILIENQILNSNFNDSAESNEYFSNKNWKNHAPKRNYSLNPASLRNINYQNKDFLNSVIYQHQMNIIPEMPIRPLTSLTEAKNKNLFLNLEAENSICHSCHEIVDDNEIIYFCSCQRIFHFACLSEFLARNAKTIHNPCDECSNNFKIFYFKLVEKDEEDENQNSYDNTLIEKTNGRSRTNFNGNSTINFNTSSVIDTNINYLDNYENYLSFPMQINHEKMSELISKNEYNKNNFMNTTPYSIGRIPLSPIPINDTPYTGKTKTKNFSIVNQNSENNNQNEGD